MTTVDLDSLYKDVNFQSLGKRSKLLPVSWDSNYYFYRVKINLNVNLFYLTLWIYNYSSQEVDKEEEKGL